jgi:hypothetical protein
MSVVVVTAAAVAVAIQFNAVYLLTRYFQQQNVQLQNQHTITSQHSLHNANSPTKQENSFIKSCLRR